MSCLSGGGLCLQLGTQKSASGGGEPPEIIITRPLLPRRTIPRSRDWDRDSGELNREEDERHTEQDS